MRRSEDVQDVFWTSYVVQFTSCVYGVMKAIENKLLVKSNETNQSWSIFRNSLFNAICSKYWNIVMTSLWRHSHLSKCVKYVQVKWCMHPPSLVAIRPVEVQILKNRDGQNLTSMPPSAFEYGAQSFSWKKV